MEAHFTSFYNIYMLLINYYINKVVFDMSRKLCALAKAF